MLKYFSLLFFCININCVANTLVNCSNINDSTSKIATNILNYMCSYSNLNKINYITENTKVLNDWVVKGYFFMIDKTENAILIPYAIFKKLLCLSYAKYNSDNLIYASDKFSISNSPRIQNISNTSYLIKIPINSMNKFIATNEYYRNYYGAYNFENILRALLIVITIAGGAVLCCFCICKFSPKKKVYFATKKNIDIEKNSLKIKDCAKL